MLTGSWTLELIHIWKTKFLPCFNKQKSMASQWQELGLLVMAVTAPCSTLQGHITSKCSRWQIFIFLFSFSLFIIILIYFLMIFVSFCVSKGLDFVISEARKYGIKLVLSMVNNYDQFGGKKQYVNWARGQGQPISSDDDFFTNSVVKQYYKNHIKVITFNPSHSSVLFLPFVVLFFFIRHWSGPRSIFSIKLLSLFLFFSKKKNLA